MSILELRLLSEEDDGRALSPEQWARYEQYVAEIFGALGMPVAASGDDDRVARNAAVLDLRRALADVASFLGDEGGTGSPILRRGSPCLAE